jgi:intracellular septation protein
MSQPLSPKTRNLIRAGVDYAGPLAFLVGFLVTKNLLTATWALVGASGLALVVGYSAERRIAPMPLFSGLAALIFGTLTLVFHDTRFVKIKPTVINLILAVIMFGGVWLKKNPLKALLGEAIKLPDPAWRTLTLRYGVFFLCTAILNEAVWRSQPDSVWIWFRMPGLQILAIVFSLCQLPLMLKHAEDDETSKAN